MEPGTKLKVNVQQLNEGEINKRVVVKNIIPLDIAVLGCPTRGLFFYKIEIIKCKNSARVKAP